MAPDLFSSDNKNAVYLCQEIKQVPYNLETSETGSWYNNILHMDLTITTMNIHK
jgi:hypothetical protein